VCACGDYTWIRYVDKPVAWAFTNAGMYVSIFPSLVDSLAVRLENRTQQDQRMQLGYWRRWSRKGGMVDRSKRWWGSCISLLLGALVTVGGLRGGGRTGACEEAWVGAVRACAGGCEECEGD